MEDEKTRLREIADKLDCVTGDDLELLANVTPVTRDAWRKRRTGPPAILFGNQYLYPRKQLREYLQTLIREPRPTVDAKSFL